MKRLTIKPGEKIREIKMLICNYLDCSNESTLSISFFESHGLFSGFLRQNFPLFRNGFNPLMYCIF